MAGSGTTARDGDELLTRALGLVEAAESPGLPLRLLGGLAVKARCPSSALPPFLRRSSDADFVAGARCDRVEAFFASQGWTGDREFNLYNGASRLIFRSPAGDKADVFVGTFRMCHEIPLAGRLTVDPVSIPLAELLLTKLQVVEANAKDYSDAASILADHDVGGTDGEAINGARVASLCGADWGLWKTASTALERLDAWVGAELGEGPSATLIRGRIKRILEYMEAESKTLAWRLRATVGERVKWYEIPEEAER
jgi:hypothetical protein